MKILKKCMVLALSIMIVLSVIPVQQVRVLAASKVSINKTEASIWVKNYIDLKITGTASKVTWKSSNTKVATVSSSGNVTGVKVGKVTITATVSKKKYTCTVTVKQEKDISCLEDLVDIIERDYSVDRETLSEIMGIVRIQLNPFYKMIDINNDGVKELLAKINYEWHHLGDPDIVIFAVKNGKAVVAGKFDLGGDLPGMRYYINTKYNCLVTICDNRHESFKINNVKAFECNITLCNVGDSSYYNMTDGGEITKNEFNALIKKYYNPNDLEEIILDGTLPEYEYEEEIW